ncbi:hypothetical protein SASPL_101436 [Salvia splendens]|uniref:Uncharacterized protein n=1 Tax=Salvia splendens TaxID=180675 RepID=A0A8X8YUT7_SALSN|nr:hypothetical protein SASPL_101436 [Salvia splendens]
MQAEDARTPRQELRRIPTPMCRPPPPPRKKRVQHRILPPKEGYFQPPDLELFFSVDYGRLRGAAVD